MTKYKTRASPTVEIAPPKEKKKYIEIKPRVEKESINGIFTRKSLRLFIIGVAILFPSKIPRGATLIRIRMELKNINCIPGSSYPICWWRYIPKKRSKKLVNGPANAIEARTKSVLVRNTSVLTGMTAAPRSGTKIMWNFIPFLSIIAPCPNSCREMLNVMAIIAVLSILMRYKANTKRMKLIGVIKTHLSIFKLPPRMERD